jgi:hypothetical protein
VPGLNAAGNVTDPSQQVSQAAANGSRVGRDQFQPRRRRHPSRIPTIGQRGRLGSPLPGATRCGVATPTVRSSTRPAASPGRALDVGAGEGGDAIWLAERGWSVTASTSRGVHSRASSAITRTRTHSTPFGAGSYDLLSTQYASIPRTPDDRAVRNLLPAVAPGGTLLVVSHDLEPMRAPSTRAPTASLRPRRLRSRRRFRSSARRRRHGTSRSTRSDPDRPGPRLLPAMSTTSCCAPDAAPADETATAHINRAMTELAARDRSQLVVAPCETSPSCRCWRGLWASASLPCHPC